MSKGPPVSGVLLLDKPPGISSNGVLGKARRLFGAAKAGHTGTLDPFATGLLPIAFGEASKFSRFLLDATKGYTALIKLGVRTSTGDTEGEVIERSSVSVDRNRIESVLRSFVGSRQQIPPMHSALKRDGVPLYKLARQGIEVERAPRDITIHELQLLAWDGVDELQVAVLCSKGTYIRVLGEDIAEAFGCVGHLTQLRRTQVGGLKLDAATTLDALAELAPAGRIAELLPPDALAAALPQVVVSAPESDMLMCGKWVAWPVAVQGEARAYGPAGHFLGIVGPGVKEGQTFLQPVRLMSAPFQMSEQIA